MLGDSEWARARTHEIAVDKFSDLTISLGSADYSVVIYASVCTARLLQLLHGFVNIRLDEVDFGEAC
jgi:hypothetical protein